MSKFERTGSPEAKNNVDSNLEMKEIQSQLDANFPEISKQYGEQLRQMSPETRTQAIAEIRNQLGILQGKQDFSQRQTLNAQIKVLSAQENETLPNFDLA